MGTVTLIINLPLTVRYLWCTVKLYRGFSINKKGENVQRAPILQGIQLLEEVDCYINSVKRAVQDHTGKMKTNGPKGTISSNTFLMVYILINGLRQLQINMHNQVGPLGLIDVSCIVLCMIHQSMYYTSINVNPSTSYHAPIVHLMISTPLHI